MACLRCGPKIVNPIMRDSNPQPESRLTVPYDELLSRQFNGFVWASNAGTQVNLGSACSGRLLVMEWVDVGVFEAVSRSLTCSSFGGCRRAVAEVVLFQTGVYLQPDVVPNPPSVRLSADPQLWATWYTGTYLPFIASLP